MAIRKWVFVGVADGSGSRRVAAAAGFETVVREVERELLDKGLKVIDKNLSRWRELSTGNDIII